MPSEPHRHAPTPLSAHDPASVAPATGSPAPSQTELAPEEEPVVTGTLFLTLVILMIIAGFWVVIYQRLLTR